MLIVGQGRETWTWVNFERRGREAWRGSVAQLVDSHLITSSRCSMLCNALAKGYLVICGLQPDKHDHTRLTQM